MEGIDVTDPVPAVEELEITSVATTEHKHVVPMAINDFALQQSEITYIATMGPRTTMPTTSHGSDKGDSRATSSPWSLMHKQQVHNLKENLERILHCAGVLVKFEQHFKLNTLLARVVSQLRDDPGLDNYQIELQKVILQHFAVRFKMTSLDLAILMGDLKMVQKILESGGIPNNVISEHDTNLRENIYYTPLHLAVVGGDSHIVDVLLKKGANANASNWLSQTPLDLAYKKGDVTMMQQLLTRDYQRRDPLHVAVQLEDINFIQRLPSLNVNAANYKKETPLHLAVEVGDRHIVDTLLEKGADVNAPNLSHKSPLDLACEKGDDLMLQQLLLKDEEGKDPLHVAVRLGDFNFIQRLPSPNGNAVNHKKETPLHFAVEGGDSDIVDVLLEKGADVNAPNLSHKSPLDLACEKGDDLMLQQLLVKDKEGKDALHVAVRLGDINFIQRLPSPNVNAANDKKETPLHLAVEVGDRHIVGTLLEKGADVNAPNLSHKSPLDLAWEKGDDLMLQQLLVKDEEGKYPLHVAVRLGDINFIQRLSPLNANVRNHKKMTPLHYLATQNFETSHVTNIVLDLANDKAFDMKALDSGGLSPFYLAILYCNTRFVIAILDSFEDQIRLNEACDMNLGPPIQIAMEGGDKFKEIMRVLMECEHVKGYIENLYRDRQVYVDAANAILVGAALIASVTFASWLQPPLNYTSYSGEGYSSLVSDLNYVDVEHNIALRAFWVFNALSFYFAIGTVVCGARSVLPRSHLFIQKIVDKLRTNLLITLTLLACSMLFVIIAFAIAGTIVLTPLIKYQWCMIVPTIVGGMVCIISLGFLVKNMVENSISVLDNSDRLNERKNKYLSKNDIQGFLP